MHLHLRDEARDSERRTPVTPADAESLIRSGWRISVETSEKRVFSDSDYRNAGCEIAAAGSWTHADPDTVILGLKELPPDPPALSNRMIHFAHIYKDQFGWRDEMERFRKGGGTLYDIEFLVDGQGRRAAAFGYWAGWMGAALALWRHLAREQGRDEPSLPLKSFAGREAVVAEIRRLAESAPVLPRCIVIGAKGRSGTGATDALKIAGCPVTEWDKEETADLGRNALLSHDLLVNCVLMTGPGLLLLERADLGRPGTRLATISDVSCDPLSDYNPLPVYDAPTSWQQPFIDIGRNGSGRTVELTAIDNLPSLVPLEASEDFSRQFAPLLNGFDGGEEWQAAKAVFEEKLRSAAAA
ncbi:saccharopine dehydrogenase [Nitratireductor sp. XY-223]|uniref:saccharopine dehydrogenase n=1 Tax=Nitratireductor sp. XY-223 TaxID=2561926 RepID=UPI0010AAF778|nr:saccharopine dehydrogenase [Nitratireductor sp. XY-223]